MRRWIDLFESTTDTRLDDCLGQIAEYLVHHHDVDFATCAAILREFGYREPVTQTRFYRALFHEITDADRARHMTVGEFFDTLKREIRFEMRGVQACAATRTGAIQFVNSTYHIMWNRPDWPTQDPSTPMADRTQAVVVVYEIETPPGAVQFSTHGLVAFLDEVPQAARGEGWRKLHDAYHDLWATKLGEEEVLVETSQGCRIVDMELYETDRDAPSGEW